MLVCVSTLQGVISNLTVARGLQELSICVDIFYIWHDEVASLETV